jgi:hypothetical protein
VRWLLIEAPSENRQETMQRSACGSVSCDVGFHLLCEERADIMLASVATFTGQWRTIAVLSTEDVGDDGDMQLDK